MSTSRMSADDVRTCPGCGRKAAHAGTFVVVTARTASVNHGRAMAQHGLELMLGGNAAIAGVMGDRNVVDVADETRVAHVCIACLGQVQLLDLFAVEDA